jgi:hypothetical protein
VTAIDYSGAAQLSPTGTVLLIVVLDLVLLAALVNAARWAVRHARKARAATASVAKTEPRAEGPSVLFGTVETEDPARPAVTVTVSERGEERTYKNNVSHTWTETDRRVEVEPFYLVLPSGTRVRVEPDPDVFLVDTLDLVRRGNPRTRRASLDHGEAAYVEGVLGTGYHPRTDAAGAREVEGLYRGALPTGFVMTNGIERMLISTEPLALRHERRARAHRQMAMAFGLALIVMNTLLFGAANLVNLAGEVVPTRLRAARTWETSNKGVSTTHYGVRSSYLEPATGAEVEVDDEVSGEAWVLATSGERIPFRVVRRWPMFFNAGTGATVGIVRVILGVAGVGGLLLLYRRRARKARSWFDEAIIVEEGTGPLEI